VRVKVFVVRAVGALATSGLMEPLPRLALNVTYGWASR